MTFQDFKTKWNPCVAAVEYINTLDTDDCAEIVKTLIANEKYEWAEWGLARLLPTKDAVEWACLCAESVLPIFEKSFPSDERPRKAILAARSGDKAASRAALAAAWAADAASAAAWAADAASAAATAAARAAAAWAALAAAWAAAAVSDPSLRASLLLQGVEMLERGEKGGA